MFDISIDIVLFQSVRRHNNDADAFFNLMILKIKTSYDYTSSVQEASLHHL